MYDVAIVGAGPAGATLARLLASRWRVLLVDRRRLWSSSGRDGPGKCCGGLLAPDAQQMLSRLGLGLPREVLVSPQLFVVRTLDLNRGLERCYQRFYINMDRERFDRWLISLVPSTVDVREGHTFKAAEPTPSGHRITLSHKGRRETLEAAVLVGADGAHSRVRQVLGQSLAARSYVAVQEWFEAEGAAPHFCAMFDPTLTDFYCWTIPKDGALLIGGAFPAGEPAVHRFALLKARLSARGLRLGPPLRREGAFLLRPTGPAQVRLGRGRLALVGEAAGWISPSSAEGISYAFRSAEALAVALAGPPDSLIDRYRRHTLSLRGNLAGKWLKSPFMYWPRLRAGVLRCGLGHIPVRGLPELMNGPGWGLSDHFLERLDRNERSYYF